MLRRSRTQVQTRRLRGQSTSKTRAPTGEQTTAQPQTSRSTVRGEVAVAGAALSRAPALGGCGFARRRLAENQEPAPSPAAACCRGGRHGLNAGPTARMPQGSTPTPGTWRRPGQWLQAVPTLTVPLLAAQPQTWRLQQAWNCPEDLA